MSTGTNGEVGGAEDSARRSGKSESAFRTISEVSSDLNVPQHVLRFWETKFSQIRPMKRGGGRRYYRPEDVALLAAIRDLLYNDGYTIKGAQKLLRENGIKSVISHSDGGRDEERQKDAVDQPSFSFAPPPAEEVSKERPRTTVTSGPVDPVPAVRPTPTGSPASEARSTPVGPPASEARSTPAGPPASEARSTPKESPLVVPSAPSVTEPTRASAAIASQALNGPDAPLSGLSRARLSQDEDEEDLSEYGEGSMMAGLTDDQRLELEVVLSDLEDLRRILRQVGL